MKLNTLENKELFFGMYISQEILNGNQEVTLSLKPINSDYLQLKKLDNLQLHDALEIFNIYHSIPSFSVSRLLFQVKELLKSNIYDLNNQTAHECAINYLRSQGYAFDWDDLTVETQEQYGWIKNTNIKF